MDLRPDTAIREDLKTKKLVQLRLKHSELNEKSGEIRGYFVVTPL